MVGSSVTLVTLVTLPQLLNLNTVEAIAFNRGISK